MNLQQSLMRLKSRSLGSIYSRERIFVSEAIDSQRTKSQGMAFTVVHNHVSLYERVLRALC